MSLSEISLAIPMENIPSHPHCKPLGKIVCGFHIIECVRFHLHQAGFGDRGDGGRKELVEETWLR